MDKVQNLKLIYKLAHTYPAAHFQDLVQEGFIGLMYAEGNYDPHKGVKFSTYAYVCIRSHMLNYYNRKVLNNKTTNIETQPINTTNDTYIFEILDGLDTAELQIVTLMIEGYTQEEIAKIIKCSIKQTRNKIYKIRNKIALNM